MSNQSGLLPHRFARVLWAEGAGAMDVHVVTLALPLLAIQVMGASPFEVGLLTACQYTGFLVFGLQAGVVVDRRSSTTVWWASASVRAALLLILIVFVLVNQQHTAPLYIIVAALSVCMVLTEISGPKVLTEIIPTHQLTTANARVGVWTSVAEVAGPLLAGLLITFAGFAPTLSVALLCSLLCVVSVRGLPSTPPRPPRAAVSMTKQVVEGIRYALAVPLIRTMLVRSSLYNFCNMATSVLFLVLLAQLHFSAAVIGIVLSVSGVAGIVAAIFVEPLSATFGLGRVLVGACVASGAVSLLLPFASHSPWFLAVIVAYALASAGIMISNVLFASVRQAVCAPAFLGRTGATIRVVIWGAIPLGALAAGALGTAIGVRPALAVAVVGELISVLPLLLSRQLRCLDSVQDALAHRIDAAPTSDGPTFDP